MQSQATMNGSTSSTANISGGGREMKDLYFTLDVPYTAAEVIIATTATVGNIFVCIVIIHERKLRTATNYFLVSLAAADTCVGVFAIPCAILTSIGIPHHNLKLCLLMLSILIMLTLCSTFSLLAIAVDRYIAILHPLRYKGIMTPSNTLALILMAWMVSFLGGLVPMMGWHKATSGTSHCLFTQVVDMKYLVYFFALTFFLLPLMIMFAIYANIFLAVRKQLRRIGNGKQGNWVGTQEVGIRKEVKTATSLFTIVFLFILCWAPLHVMNSIILLCPNCFVPPIILQTGIILTHANSALNPILYAYKLKSFRKTFKVIFSCRRKAVRPVRPPDQAPAFSSIH